MGIHRRFSALPLAAVLALGVPGALLTFSVDAAAQDEASAPGVSVDLIPVGQVVGDGLTPVTLHVLMVDANGAPVTGVSGKAYAAEGSIGKLEDAGKGLYKMSWTPPKAQATHPVEITIRGKTSDKKPIYNRWAVSVAPTIAQQVAIVSSPSQLVLGQDASATINITLSGGAAETLKEADLAILSSSGTIANLTPLGDGRFTALYTPPAKLFPHLALLTLADRRDPSKSFGALSIALVGKANFPVVGMPNSRIILKIGDREFGPIQADASGRASVPIIVPPGTGEATVISVLDDKRTEEPIDLKVPPTPRMRLFPVQSSVPADPTTPVQVRVFVARAQGGPDAAARVNFSVTAGTISAATHDGNGVYSATFTPPYGNTASQATIQVTAEDARGPQTDSITVNMVPARPAAVTLSPEPAVLASTASGFKVFGKVTGTDGVGLSGRTLAMQATGGSLSGAVKDLGGGEYEASFTASGTGPVEIVSTVKSGASGNPLRQLLVLPSRERLPNDGLSSTMITVLSLDEFGYPVANVPVTVTLAKGDGSVPAQATTDASGVAQISYTAGRAVGVADLEVKSGSVAGATGILQAPTEAKAPTELPTSGSAALATLVDSWSKIVTTTKVEREGMLGAAVTTTAGTAVAAGPIARLAITPEPASVAPGGTVILKISAADAEARGVSGKTLELIASAGTLGPIQDLGSGQYQVALTVPAGLAGEVKVSATSPEGSVSALAKIPISGASAWQQVATTPTETAVVATNEPKAPKEPKPPKEPKAPKEPKEDGDFPWLRVRAGYTGGLYSYEQAPLSSTGPLYSKRIVFGGGATSPAGAAGFSAKAKAWSPGFSYAGLEASFQTVRYTVQLPEYSEPIPDWVTNFHLGLLGRYPIALGSSSQLHIGARVGWTMDDFIVYRQSVEASQLVLSWEQLIVNSLDLGGELGFEAGDRVFGTVGGGIALANGSEMYTTKMDASVGVRLVAGLFVDGNFGYQARSVDIYHIPQGETEKSRAGELTDSLLSFGGGLGYQF